MIVYDIDTINFYTDNEYKELLEKSKINLTENDTRYINNMIDKILSKIDKRVSPIITEKILYAFLSRSADYGKIYFIKQFLFEEILKVSDFWDEQFDECLKELCDKKILIETIYSDIKYYSLNYTYLYKLGG